MNLTYLLTWIAAGGLVTLAIFSTFGLLKASSRLEDAQDERLWRLLLHDFQNQT
jgi:hypothetical protein